MLPLLQQNGVVDGNDTEILLPRTKLRSHPFRHLSLGQGPLFSGSFKQGLSLMALANHVALFPTGEPMCRLADAFRRANREFTPRRSSFRDAIRNAYEDPSWGCSSVSTHLLYFFVAVLLIMRLPFLNHTLHVILRGNFSSYIKAIFLIYIGGFSSFQKHHESTSSHRIFAHTLLLFPLPTPKREQYTDPSPQTQSRSRIITRNDCDSRPPARTESTPAYEK
jgi:hypothetical protein